MRNDTYRLIQMLVVAVTLVWSGAALADRGSTESLAKKREKTQLCFERLDADGDKRIVLEEYRAGAKEKKEEKKKDVVARNFRGVDKNNDGAISFEELKSHWDMVRAVIDPEVFDEDSNWESPLKNNE